MKSLSMSVFDLPKLPHSKFHPLSSIHQNHPNSQKNILSRYQLKPRKWQFRVAKWDFKKCSLLISRKYRFAFCAEMQNIFNHPICPMNEYSRITSNNSIFSLCTRRYINSYIHILILFKIP